MSTIGKLVVLKLDGDFEQNGFQVALEIGLEQARPSIELPGKLPPNPELLSTLNEWQQSYLNLAMPSRIAPQKIIYGGSVNRRKECQRLAEKLCDLLNTWLETKSFQEIDRRLRQVLNRDEPIRVLIRTHNRELRYLPWHLWDFIEQYPKAEISLSAPRFEQVEVTRTTTFRKKVKILAILGNRDGIDVEKDRRTLESLPKADVTFLVEPKRQEITDQLWDQPWDVLFFAGHSQTEGDQGRIHINAEESLTIHELKYGLEQAIGQGLQLAIFNSCDGLGLAHELEQLHLPQLIVMREPVPDQVAQKFAKYFLTAFSSGDSLYLAERKARQRLQGLESEFPCASWLPVICQNCPDTPPSWQSWLKQPPKLHTQYQSQLPKALGCGAIVATLVLGARWMGWLQPLEIQAFDQMMRLRSRPAMLDDRMLMVKITESDYQQLREYPLSDGTVIRLLEKISKYDPAVIGLDFLRDMPSGTKQDYQKLLDHLNKNTKVIAMCKIPDSRDSTFLKPPRMPKEQLGFSNIIPDPDQIVRRQLLSMPAQSPCPTPYALSFQLSGNYLDAQKYPLKVTSQQEWQWGESVFKQLKSRMSGYQIFDNGGYQILLNYRSPIEVARSIGVTELLNQKDADFLNRSIKGKIVLIGIDKEGLDRFRTPLSGHSGEPDTVAGVVIHAQMVSQILDAVIDGQQSLIWAWSPWREGVWIIGWSLIGGIIVWFSRSLVVLIILGSGALIILSASSWFIFQQNGWIPFVPPALGLVITAGSLIAPSAFQSKQS